MSTINFSLTIGDKFNAPIGESNKSSSSKKFIKLTTRNGEKFRIDRKTAQVSATFRRMLDDLGENEQACPSILVDCSSCEVLGKVLDWAAHHKDDKVRDIPASDDEYSVWDLLYFNVSDNVLLKIMVVADYLEMTRLLRQTMNMMRHRLKGQPLEQLRERSGWYRDVANRLSAEEELQLSREASWVKLS